MAPTSASSFTADDRYRLVIVGRPRRWFPESTDSRHPPSGGRSDRAPSATDALRICRGGEPAVGFQREDRLDGLVERGAMAGDRRVARLRADRLQVVEQGAHAAGDLKLPGAGMPDLGEPEVEVVVPGRRGHDDAGHA